jgi:site-specific DNA-adenine methylase
MAKYHGGKQKIGEEIAKTIAYVVEQSGLQFKGYVEPFCGMLGVYQHIPDFLPQIKRFEAGDINPSVIKMWKSLQKGWTPPSLCSKKRFVELRGNGRSSAEKGFIGHACSYRGVYFNMFFQSNLGPVIERLKRVSLKLDNVNFTSGEYSQFSKLKGWVIYCDPPYFIGSRYVTEEDIIRKFDYEKFYKWAEGMAKNNLVFISERAYLPYLQVGSYSNNEKLYLIN